METIDRDIVLVAAHQLHDSVLADLTSACARANAKILEWRGEASVDEVLAANAAQTDTKLVVVGGLPAGQRRIPRDVLDLVTNVLPKAPLLLLCNEPLVGTTAKLHDGKVTLLDPATTPRLYSQLRILLARAGASRGRSFWLGRASSQMRADVTVHDDDSSIIAAFHDPSTPPSAPAMALAAELARHAMSEQDRTRELASALGTSTGFLNFDASVETFHICWPSTTHRLWAFSTQRLPRLFDVAAACVANAWLRIAATAGDILLAVRLADADAKLDERRMYELKATIEEGGPAVLDLMQTWIAQAPAIASAFVVEVC